jgi:hypothetical protein
MGTFTRLTGRIPKTERNVCRGLPCGIGAAVREVLSNTVNHTSIRPGCSRLRRITGATSKKAFVWVVRNHPERAYTTHTR